VCVCFFFFFFFFFPRGAATVTWQPHKNFTGESAAWANPSGKAKRVTRWYGHSSTSKPLPSLLGPPPPRWLLVVVLLLPTLGRGRRLCSGACDEAGNRWSRKRRRRRCCGGGGGGSGRGAAALLARSLADGTRPVGVKHATT
jgi:hypothetical protein